MITRRSPVIVIALALAYVTASVASAQEQTPRDQSGHPRAWWNQPQKIEDLGLSQEQRASMDDYLSVYLEKRRESLDQHKEEMESFGGALLRGDGAAARRHGQSATAAAAAPFADQIQMMTDVAEVLTREQREKLVEKTPRMLSRFWILPTDNSRGGFVGRARADGRGQ